MSIRVTGCKWDDFPIGTRVKVISEGVDFAFFRGETGTVVRHSDHGRYLGLIVEFDEPRVYVDGSVEVEFNFNPYNLAPFGQPVQLYEDHSVLRQLDPIPLDVWEFDDPRPPGIPLTNTRKDAPMTGALEGRCNE